MRLSRTLTLRPVRSLLDGASLTPRQTADSKLNQTVSSWISSHLTSSMTTWEKVKAIYDGLLKLEYGTPDDSVIDTSGMSMDELMSLYFDGPEYNARLLLLSGSGTEEHFAAALASLLRAIGLNATGCRRDCLSGYRADDRYSFQLGHRQHQRYQLHI